MSSQFLKSIWSFIQSGGALFLFFVFTIILNHRMGYISLVGIFCILVFLLNLSVPYIKKETLLLLLYVFTFICFSMLNGEAYSVSTFVLYGIAPIFFFIFGSELVKRFKSEKRITIAWLIVVIGYTLDIFIISISNIVSTGSLISDVRSLTFDDGSVDYSISATQIGLSLDIAMVGLPLFIIAKNHWLKFSFLLLSFFALISTFHLLNRTAIAVAILCFITVIGYKSRKNLKVIITAILAIIAVIVILRFFNIISDELLILYTDRNTDISTFGDRSYRWSNALTNLFTEPFGWADNSIYYIHNMWLDVARISGIIPFFILVFISIDSFHSTFKLVKIYESELSYFLLGLNICFFSSCFVEPIYGGTHFLLYLMLWGSEKQLISYYKI